MLFGTEVGLGLRDIVLDGDPAPPPLKGHSPLIFGQCSLWPNDWMDQDGTWNGGRPRRLCDEWGPSYARTEGTATPPNFWPRRLDG